MADDLSARAAGSMWPTGQGTDMTSDPDRAMTAPGGVPAAAMGGDWARPDVPAVQPQHFAPSTHVDGGEPPYDSAAWDGDLPREWGPR